MLRVVHVIILCVVRNSSTISSNSQDVFTLSIFTYDKHKVFIVHKTSTEDNTYLKTLVLNFKVNTATV